MQRKNFRPESNFSLVMSTLKMISYDEHLRALIGSSRVDSIDGLKVARAERKRPRKTRFAKPLGPNHGSRNTGFSGEP